MMNATNYYGKVRQGILGTANNEKKTPYIALTITLTHEAENGQWVDIQPVDRTVYWHLSDAAWPHTVKRLETIGFTGDFNTIAFAGDAVDAGTEWNCQHEEFQGKTRERWDLANWGDGGKEHISPAGDDVRKFNARWRTDHAANRPPAGRPAPPPKTTAVTVGDEKQSEFDPDGIPF